MKINVSTSSLHGKIDANVSKSYTQRAYAIAALSTATSQIKRASWSDDAIAALQIVRNLGAQVSVEDESMWITPNVLPVQNIWFAGEAGLSLRMFSAIAASLERKIEIDGHGSLKTRPVDFIVDVLRVMGASISGDSLPLAIHGPITSGTYTIDGSLSSQLLTGLLIALPLLKGDTKLIVENLSSIPYIDMTMEMMRRYGVEISHDNYQVFNIQGGQSYRGAKLTIEADWSGLAFVLVAGAMARNSSDEDNVTVSGVLNESKQADRAIVDVLETIGCKLSFDNGSDMGDGVGSITVKSSELDAFSFDATHCPDLIPPLCVLATQCHGVTRIKGVHRLKHKESDRGVVLTRELGKLGARIEIADDLMIVAGRQTLHGAETNACGDHRIAMALVCAGLVAKGETVILGAECVSKSYHNFYRDMRKLHGELSGDNDLFINRIALNYLK